MIKNFLVRSFIKRALLWLSLQLGVPEKAVAQKQEWDWPKKDDNWVRPDF